MMCRFSGLMYLINVVYFFAEQDVVNHVENSEAKESLMRIFGGNNYKMQRLYLAVNGLFAENDDDVPRHLIFLEIQHVLKGRGMSEAAARRFSVAIQRKISAKALDAVPPPQDDNPKNTLEGCDVEELDELYQDDDDEFCREDIAQLEERAEEEAQTSDRMLNLRGDDEIEEEIEPEQHPDRHYTEPWLDELVNEMKEIREEEVLYMQRMKELGEDRVEVVGVDQPDKELDYIMAGELDVELDDDYHGGNDDANDETSRSGDEEQPSHFVDGNHVVAEEIEEGVLSDYVDDDDDSEDGEPERDGLENIEVADDEESHESVDDAYSEGEDNNDEFGVAAEREILGGVEPQGDPWCMYEGEFDGFTNDNLYDSE